MEYNYGEGTIMADQIKHNIFYKIIIWLIPDFAQIDTLKQEIDDLRNAVSAIPATTYEIKLESLAKDIMPTVPTILKVDKESGKSVPDDEARIKRAFGLARAWLAEVYE